MELSAKEKELQRKALNRFRNRGVAILDEVPADWIEIKGAQTAPIGYTWYCNGKSIFGKDYKNALVKDE